MTAALQPQPAACASCGRPFAAPFCDHVQAAIAALTAAPERTVDDYFAYAEALLATQLCDEADVVVAPPPRRRYSGADLRRGYCPTAAYYAVRRS